MSPETPAAHLARLKAEFPRWSIKQVRRGCGWTAQRRNRHRIDAVYAPTLPALEAELTNREGRQR